MPGLVAISSVDADANLTQKITVATAGTPVTGPAISNGGGWLLKAKETNTGACWYMYTGTTAANKGVPLGVGEVMYVPVASLSSLDFDAATSGNIIMASKA
jgi:hypothetical protein